MEVYDFSARNYDPKLGRFFSIDPIPTVGSPYIYCANNPLRYTDPSGMEAVPHHSSDPSTKGIGGGGGGRRSEYDWEFVKSGLWSNSYFYPGIGSGGVYGWGYSELENGDIVAVPFWTSGLLDASNNPFNTFGSAFHNAYGLYQRELSGTLLAADAGTSDVPSQATADALKKAEKLKKEQSYLTDYISKEYKRTAGMTLMVTGAGLLIYGAWHIEHTISHASMLGVGTIHSLLHGGICFMGGAIAYSLGMQLYLEGGGM